jgi:hypothetical protein
VRARLVELVLVASVSYGSEGLAQGEGFTMPCRNGRGTAWSRSPSARNVGLALGAQETRPERGDRRCSRLLGRGAVSGHGVEGVAS